MMDEEDTFQMDEKLINIPETHNNATISIFNNITNMAGLVASTLLLMQEKGSVIDGIETTFNTLANDISSHDENIINLDKFISEQQQAYSVDQIDQDAETIQKGIEDIESSIEQLVIGLNYSNQESNEDSNEDSNEESNQEQNEESIEQI